MAIISWDSSIILNVRLIDEQHKELVDLINAFYESIRKKEPDTAILELLQGLLDYTRFHFTDEQDLMRKHNYPGLKHQLEEHKDFIQHISDCHQRISEGKLVVSLEITSYLRSWLIDHIKGTDKLLAEFLNQRGITT